MTKDTIKVGLEVETDKGVALGEFKSLSNGIQKTIDEVRKLKKEIGELAGATKDVSLDKIFKEIGGIKSLLSSGGIQAGLTNATTSGIVAQRKSLPGAVENTLLGNQFSTTSSIVRNNRRQDLINTDVSNVKDNVVKQQALLAKAQEKMAALQKLKGPKDAEVIRLQEEVKLREAVFQLAKKTRKAEEAATRQQVRKAETLRLTQENRIKALKTDTAAQNRNIKNITQAVVAEKARNQSITKGLKSERLRGIIARRNDQITKATIANNGKRNKIADQLALKNEATRKLLKRILVLERKITNAKKNQKKEVSLKEKGDQTRKLKQESLFGDGGAFLFKTQFRLLAHFKLIQSVAGAYGFLSNFVVELDKNMHNLQAITATTDTEMAGLRKTVIAVSETTKFTAVEVADAARILGQAGFSTNDIRKTLQSVTLLAAATGTDLTQSVDVMTSVMAVFNLEASQSGKVVNVLTAAINNSKLDMNKLALGIQFASNIAKQAGLDFSELTAVLGGLANAGIRSGSTLGTGVRQVLIGLQKPSENLKRKLKQLGLTMEDVNIRSQGFSGVMRNLRDAGFTAADAMHAFKIRSAAAATAIIHNIEGIERLEEIFLLTEAAAKANATQMKSYSNQLDKFKSIAGSLGDEIGGNLLGALTSILKVVNELFSSGSQNSASGAFAGLLKVVGGGLLAAGIGLIAKMLVTLTTGLFTYSVASTGATTATMRFWGALKLLGRSTPFLVVSGLTAVAEILYAVFGGATDAADKLQAELDRLKGSIEDIEKSNNSYDESISRVIDKFDKLSPGTQALRNETLRLSQQYLGFAEAIKKSTNGAQGLIDTLRKLKGEQAGLSEKLYQTQGDTLKIQRQGIASGIDLSPFALKSDTRDLSKFSVGNPLMERAIKVLQGKEGGIGQLNGIVVSNLATNISNQLNSKNSPIQGFARAAATKLSERLLTLSKSLNKIAEIDLQLLNAKEKELAAKANANPIVIRLKGLVGSGGELASRVRKAERTIRGKKGTDIQKREFARKTAAPLVAEAEAARDEIKKLKGAQRDALAKTLINLNEFISELKSLVSGTEKAAADDSNRILSQTIKNAKREIATGLKRASTTTDSELVKTLMAEAQGKIMDKIRADLKDKIDNTLLDLNPTEKAAELERQMQDITEKMLGDSLQFAKQIGQAITRKFKLVSKALKNKLEARNQPLQNVVNNLQAQAAAGSNRTNQSSIGSIQIQTIKNKADLANKAVLEDNLRANRENLLVAKEHAVEAKASLVAAEAALRVMYLEGASLKEQEVQLAAIAGLRATDTEAGKEINKLLKEQAQLNDKILEGYGKIPADGIGANIKNSITEFLKSGDASTNVAKQVGDNLQGIFTSIRDGMAGAVRDVLTGTTSIGGMFKAMALSIAESFLNLAAKLAANAILKGILGFVLNLGFGSLGSQSNGDFARPSGLFSGGFSGIPGSAAGGPVTGGVPGRDSVVKRLMPGEFVMRKSAVDSVGRDFLENLNAKGNSKSSESAGKISAANDNTAGSMQQVNVYVVSEDQKPIPGPGDIIATIGDNIRRGGSVKKLIKQVNMGAL